MEEIPRKHLFRFGVFEADQHTGELRKQGRRMQLQGQPFDILIMLLERPGELVSRTQIRERLWPDGTFVDFDHSLNTAVNKIRDVLGDSASSPRFVETLARRGYRFIAPVQIVNGSSVAALDTISADESRPGVPLPDTPQDRNPQLKAALPATLLTGSHEIPEASHRLVRVLFL